RYVDRLPKAALTVTRWPCGSNTKAKGTPPTAVAVGAFESCPSSDTLNTSTEPPLLPFNVMTRCRPSGVKPTCPGDCRNPGGLLLARPRERCDPVIGCSRPPAMRYPAT